MYFTSRVIICYGPPVAISKYCKIGIVRPESAYVLLLHFTYASSIGGHAGCAEFSFSHSAEFSFLPFLQESVRTEESGSGS